MRGTIRKKRRWWGDKFITLMVIPERTRRVHKFLLPFFILKIGLVLITLTVVFVILVSMDYVHVLGRMAENKRLKGENFKLRQEIQLIRNRVDSMETTVERVRNYGKKLELLTGQEQNDSSRKQKSFFKPEDSRTPATVKGKKRSQWRVPGTKYSLEDRLMKLESVTLNTESGLSQLQQYLVMQTSIADATPSLMPIAGWISSGFGYRRHPKDGRYRRHLGIDIFAEPGSPVRAPASGWVIFAGRKSGYGKVVVIDHGHGIRTLFAHNSKLFVNKGNKIKRGAVISQVGSTGRTTGPHLHYEVRKNGVPVNPVPFFSSAAY